MLPSPLFCLLLLLQALPPPPLARSTPWPHEWKNVFSRNLPAFHSLICSICAQPRCSCGRPRPGLPPAHAHEHVQVEPLLPGSSAGEALAPPAWPRCDGVTCHLCAWGSHHLGKAMVPQAEVVQGTPSPGRLVKTQVSAHCLLSLTSQRDQVWVIFISFCLVLCF